MAEFEVSVFPNPNKGNFSLKLKLTENAYIEVLVLDERGRIVKSTDTKHLKSGEHLLRYTNVGMTSGLYFLEVKWYDADGNQIGIRHKEKIMIIKQ